MELSFSNILYFIAYTAPLLIPSMLVLLSLMNSNGIGGMIYSVIMIVVYFFGVILQNTANVTMSGPKNVVCNIFGSNNYIFPSMSSLLLFATFGYVLTPLIMSGNILHYMPLVSVLGVITIVDIFVKTMNKCSNYMGIVIGSLLGGSFGALAGFLMYHNLSSGLLIQPSGESNNVVCKKPTKSKFKCSVYKNGTLIKQM